MIWKTRKQGNFKSNVRDSHDNDTAGNTYMSRWDIQIKGFK